MKKLPYFHSNFKCERPQNFFTSKNTSFTMIFNEKRTVLITYFNETGSALHNDPSVVSGHGALRDPVFLTGIARNCIILLLASEKRAVERGRKCQPCKSHTC